MKSRDIIWPAYRSMVLYEQMYLIIHHRVLFVLLGLVITSKIEWYGYLVLHFSIYYDSVVE